MNSTSESTSQLLTKPSVFWSAGANRSIVFDLATGRFINVPLGVTKVLDHCGRSPFSVESVLSQFSSHRSTVQGYLSTLRNLGMVIRVPEFASFDPLSIRPRQIERIDNLYLDVGPHIDAIWLKHTGGQLRRQFRTRCLILRLAETSAQALDKCCSLVETGRQLGFHQLGLWPLWSGDQPQPSPFPEVDFILSGEHVEHHCPGAMRRKPVPNLLMDSSQKLFCNLEDFRLNRVTAARTGNLYIDGDQTAWPHPFDTRYRLGCAESWQALASILGSQRWRDYRTATKSKNKKCSRCEYRELCPNPLWFREVAEDLASPPSNCGYDIASGKWKTLPENTLPSAI